jgi:hypothetical protein
MVVLDFILFEISIQLELIYKKYFILIQNSFENEVEKAKFDFDDSVHCTVSILIILYRIQIVRILVGVVLIE